MEGAIMRKTIASILAAAMLCVPLAACGQPQTTSGEASDQAAATSASEADQPSKAGGASTKASSLGTVPNAIAEDKDAVAFEDQLFRSYGLLTNARRMPIKEFMAHWSNLRLAASLGKLPVSLKTCDALLTAAQPAHVQKAAGTALNEKDADAYRCELIRNALA
jgi:hypothetical protein